jgi:phosphopantothenoylcysteine decarboxylase/phosphopantothenate--cysteine ligase
MNDSSKARILLGISGGIAAYKSPEIVRRLRDEGADVRVVITPSAARLVSPAVFQAVSGHPVRGELWDEQAEAAMGHIELARWADLVLIAPATANIMSELAAGSAGSLLTTLCLASDAPLLVAPAMNQAMWRNPATQHNLATLKGRGVTMLGPASGEQACGDTGPGRMLEPSEIVAEVLAQRPFATGALQNLSVLVTAGPTREPIDPVRFVSNRSSGKMGFAIARAAAAAGARVTLVAGPVNLPTPAGVKRVDVETAGQMHEATLSRVGESHIYIGAAAIADYRPAEIAVHKIKKRHDTLELDMVRAPDVLREVAALADGPFTVGFAAETQELEAHAREKLERKQLDMIIANLVGERLGFDSDENSALVIWPGGQTALPAMSKTRLATQLVDLIAERYRLTESAPTPLRQPSVT